MVLVIGWATSECQPDAISVSLSTSVHLAVPLSVRLCRSGSERTLDHPWTIWWAYVAGPLGAFVDGPGMVQGGRSCDPADSGPLGAALLLRASVENFDEGRPNPSSGVRGGFTWRLARCFGVPEWARS